MPKLSPAQVAALQLASTAELTRWAGGWWAPADAPAILDGAYRRPDKYATVQTLRALYNRKLLERRDSGAPLWAHPYTITDAGRAALRNATVPM